MLNKACICFIIAILFFAIGIEVFQRGMFMDGLIYATISKNLSIGQGSFWFPVFNSGVHNPFHEHPPLFFYLESLFFQILGESFYVEKVFTLFLLVLTSIGIYKIWQFVHKYNPDKLKFWWLPVLFIILVPSFSWSFKNNMLENLMMLFTTFSVLFQLLASRTNSPMKWVMLFLGSLCILGAFLTKGPVGLFPLVFLLIYGLVFRSKFEKAFWLSVGLVAGVLISSLVIYWAEPESIAAIGQYLDQQVISSIKGERRNNTRLHLFGVFFKEFSIYLILLFGFILYRAVGKSKIASENNKWTLVFLLTGLSASLPIIVSTKILSFYILPSVPFFALAIALYAIPSIDSARVRLNWFQKNRKLIFALSLFCLAVSIFYTFSRYGNYLRDREVQEDVDILSTLITKGEIINLHPSIQSDYVLMAYAKRNQDIDLVRDYTNPNIHFMLVPKNEKVPSGYSVTSDILNGYKLCRITFSENDIQKDKSK